MGERLAFVWNSIVAPALASVALALAMALVLFATRPDRAQNRRLALVLFLEATTLLAGGALMYLVDEARDAYAFNAVAAVGYLALPFAYLRFLATLDSPLARPFRRPLVDRALLVGVFASPLLYLAAPWLWLGAPVRGSFAPWDVLSGPVFFGADLLLWGLTWTSLFGLLVAYTAMRASPIGSVERRRARYVAAAFAVRDLALVAAAFLVVVLVPALAPGGGSEVRGAQAVLWILARAATLLVYVPVLAYGVLRSQLFDIDLRVRGVLRHGMLLAAFALVYFGAGEAASRLGASDATRWIGFVAIGLLLLLLPLLQRLLDRATAAATPGASGEALEQRRFEVYAAALDEGLGSGERPAASAVLTDLRRRLGITDAEHQVLLRAAQAQEVRRGLSPGRRFRSRYAVERMVGRGGSGEVFLARDLETHRDVAIKRLTGERLREAKAVAQFETEARHVASTEHPHVIAVHEFVALGEDAYLVMEYAPGGTLQQRIERGGPLPEQEARRFAREVLSALAALHARGVVHGDVKPSNVLLDATGRAKLADFALARDYVSGETVGGAPERPLGTWSYMSPEQARGLRPTPRSDLYSAAAMLYALLAGRPPIAIDEADDHLARMRIAREAPALPLAGVSEATNAALARSLAKAPSERFPDALAMAAALE